MNKDNCFIFKSCDYDPARRSLLLNYGYGPGEEFTEEITFPGARTDFSAPEMLALDGLMKALHLAAGISYYKARCSGIIIIENQNISPVEAEFFDKFYLMGLGEFAMENDLDLRDVIKFPAKGAAPPCPAPVKLDSQCVVPIGGGKDSLVSVEILRASRRVFRPIAINAGPPILKVIKAAGCENPILITRKIDPRLFELNAQGAYNGHVPITGILSFIMAFASVLYGFDTVIMSNEHSANEGNLVRNGMNINHQYSKSLEFEQDFSHFITRHIMADFAYFSLLRPLSESGIAALFARSPQYFPIFKSCNRNFHICEGERRYGWCCTCPKCHFVYLALAPFIDKERMKAIFGRDILDDEAQEDGYRELLGLRGHKPFECVGEIEECRILLKSLALMPDWQGSQLVQKLAPKISEAGLKLADLTALALTKYPDHNLPPEFERMLDEFIGS